MSIGNDLFVVLVVYFMKRLLVFVFVGAIVASCTFDEVLVEPQAAVMETAPASEPPYSRLHLNMRSLSSSYGHTVKVHSILLGGTAEGEHFYRDGTYIPEDDVWTDLVLDNENPLTFMFDESGLNGNAAALPADYAPILKDTCLMLFPQDFSEVGLPLEVDFSVMEGETTIMRDVMQTRVRTELMQGEKFTISLDLTLVPISFDVSIEDWFDEEQINIVI